MKILGGVAGGLNANHAFSSPASTREERRAYLIAKKRETERHMGPSLAALERNIPLSLGSLEKRCMEEWMGISNELKQYINNKSGRSN